MMRCNKPSTHLAAYGYQACRAHTEYGMTPVDNPGRCDKPVETREHFFGRVALEKDEDKE